MALFKPFMGSRTSLDAQEKHAGYAYFCTDDGSFHIDYIDANGVLQRKQINAKDAETFNSHTADEFLLETDIDTVLAQAKASGEFDGADGAKGDDGIGIVSVQQTTTSTADDGNNIITVRLTNGTTSTFTVQNGSKGSKGDQGIQGETGAPGYSPVRGTDYWTNADKAEIKSYVDEAILGGEW